MALLKKIVRGDKQDKNTQTMYLTQLIDKQQQSTVQKQEKIIQENKDTQIRMLIKLQIKQTIIKQYTVGQYYKKEVLRLTSKTSLERERQNLKQINQELPKPKKSAISQKILLLIKKITFRDGGTMPVQLLNLQSKTEEK
ncbi:hypothetical protein ABPG74_022428 [Tetrahymena malaccensis]